LKSIIDKWKNGKLTSADVNIRVMQHKDLMKQQDRLVPDDLIITVIFLSKTSVLDHVYNYSNQS